MRGLMLSLAFAVVVALAGPARVAHAAGPMPSLHNAAPAFALQVPDKKIEITIGDRNAGPHWYRNPVWIAIGVLAVVVLILLIVVATRGGGGTTIIRE